jgi:hypothetical protein
MHSFEQCRTLFADTPFSVSLTGSNSWARFRATALIAFLLLVVSGCAGGLPLQSAVASEGESAASNGPLSDISNYIFPTPTPVVQPNVTAVVITEGSRANVRSGPGLDFPIVAKANPGDSFQVVSKSADGEWWQICCVNSVDGTVVEVGESAWLANVVTKIEGEVEKISALNSVFPDHIEASWVVHWQCGSDRCQVKQCSAKVGAKSSNDSTQQWLRVRHEVTWDEACFSTDAWVFEIDKYTGRERSGLYADNFLYNYWLGAEPGPATNVYTLDNGRKVVVWCSGPHEAEVEEGEGWLTVYEGNTCHDIYTGTLISLSYTKRWLYTGEYEGKQYDRAYFGDYESLEQHLISANANLYYID